MLQIPSMWRTELLHPLSVHFPIALLTMAALCGLVYLFVRQKSFAPYLRFSTSLLLLSGVALFWVAYYTGDQAYEVVVRTICDPSVLKDHLFWANTSAYIFSAAALLEIARYIFHLQKKAWTTLLVVLLLTGGTAAISYAGHLGATVVYQQAGGVYTPDGDCTGF
ncbi:DUF2231 domain-containing protein [Roseivirga sp. BDSF3-8]|uniref:DUF2231 domain-containing protein n=1 Tax=Roseivirga sp. BDSF3-8 TaxID=3241598 RepID=UPI003531BCBF